MRLPEILNRTVIAQLAAGLLPGSDNATMLAVLQERYPTHGIRLVKTCGNWDRDGRLLSADGVEIASHFRKWVHAEVSAAGGSAEAVWQAHKDKGWRVTRFHGQTLYFVAQYGPAPEDFFQLEINIVQEKWHCPAFEPDERFGRPQNVYDLAYGADAIAFTLANQPIGEPICEFSELTNVAGFIRQMAELDHQTRLAALPDLRERTVTLIATGEGAGPGKEVPFLEAYPDYLIQELPIVRWMKDWAASSAGKGGHRLCDHWILNFEDYEREGRRIMSAVPMWIDGHSDLPAIHVPRYDNIYQMMGDLKAFDDAAGYDFAWYFHMLHGNRIKYEVGEDIAAAVREERIGLPECDAVVLLSWNDSHYGF